MIDLTSPKVLYPTALFAILSPGLLLKLPGSSIKNVWMTGTTNKKSVFFHALVFLILYKLIAMKMGLVLTRADLAVTVLLFIMLSPGMLLTIPGGEGTSPIAVMVHMAVFAVVFALLRKQFPRFY